MRNIFLILILIICISVSGSAQSQTENASDKIIAQIVGTWRITDGVNMNPQKAPTKKTTSSNHLIVLQFNREGRYKTTNSQMIIDSGSYRLNENHHRLYLESDVIKGEPKEWDVTLNKNTMTLQADSTKSKQHVKYVYKMDAVSSH